MSGAVQAHPLCAKLEDEGDAFLVTFPEGDFEVSGVRVVYSVVGKQRALEILLDHLEKHLRERRAGTV